ncbi:MAG TPA: hypothetical protein VG405_03240 [Solirubrobacteraceae bacterium]|jgi:hypothetical protein|nr:hypothetical protein [Solirubrobacteraceae bacterium]
MATVKTASDLYGLPLDQFTPERNELVKRLRAEGEKEEAARVGKLRKPTLPAWTVNRLVRTQKKGIKRLFDAGDAVATAQSKGQSDKLRAAVSQQREALGDLMSLAEGLLDSEGRAPAAGVLERVGQTLRAAAIDPDAREQVQDGCLTRELQFSGLGGLGASDGSASRERKADEQARRQRQEQIQAAREQEHQAKQDLQLAQKDLRQADKALRQAEKSRDAAGEQVHAAEAALAEAGTVLEKLQRGGK